MSIIESDPESNHSIPSFSPEKFVEPSLDNHHEHHCYCEHGQTSPSAYPRRHNAWLKRLIFPAMLATLLAPAALFAWNQVDWASSADENVVRRDTYAGIHVSPNLHRVLKIAFPCVIVGIVSVIVILLVSWKICYNRRKRKIQWANKNQEDWDALAVARGAATDEINRTLKDGGYRSSGFLSKKGK